MTTTTTTHPFEIAKLGRAPFRFEGVEHRTFRAAPDAPAQVGGSCDYCGTGISYFHWITDANGARFKVGSECVKKTDPKLYAQIKEARRSERALERAARRIEREDDVARARVAKLDAYLNKNPAIAAAFEIGGKHAETEKGRILADIHSKAARFGSLTEKQESFVLRLADELANPKVELPKMTAPEGRQEITGKVISAKSRPGYAYGTTEWKMTVAVEVDGSEFLVWSTIPQSIQDVYFAVFNAARDAARDANIDFEAGLARWLRGREVTFAATLARSDRDEHFAFAKRPSKATVKLTETECEWLKAAGVAK